MNAHFGISPPAFRRDPTRFRVHDIFLVCREQGNPTICDFLIPFHADDFMEEDGFIVGVYGRVFSDGYGEYGVNIPDVVMNYTQYLEKQTAAVRIQHAWKRYRASKVIQAAWRHWLMKKNERWNLRSFTGVAFLALEAIRATA